MPSTRGTNRQEEIFFFFFKDYSNNITSEVQLKLKLNFNVLGHRRKKIKDSNLVEQNQITKPKRKGKKYNEREKGYPESHRHNRVREEWRSKLDVKNYNDDDNNRNHKNNNNEEWVHGVNPGSRPPVLVVFFFLFLCLINIDIVI